MKQTMKENWAQYDAERKSGFKWGVGMGVLALIAGLWGLIYHETTRADWQETPIVAKE